MHDLLLVSQAGGADTFNLVNCQFPFAETQKDVTDVLLFRKALV